MGSDWIGSAQRDRRNRVLRVGRCTRRHPSRGVRWGATSRSRDRPAGVRATTRLVGVPTRHSAVPQKRCGAGALERCRRHRRGERCRVDLRICDTDRIRGWLLSPTRLSPGASRSPGSVRRGAGRRSSRSITEVIGTDRVRLRRPSTRPAGSRFLATETRTSSANPSPARPRRRRRDGPDRCDAHRTYDHLGCRIDGGQSSPNGIHGRDRACGCS
jgi:hypothetical protein